MPVSDVALINRWIKDSDGEAFAEIVSRYSAMVYGTCVRILGDAAEAEDVTQDCFIQLARARDFRGSSLTGLLHTMATHLSLNRVRAQSRRREREIAFALRAKRDTEIDWEDLYPHIDDAIAELPEKQRYPIICHFLEGQSHQAIAQALDIDESTVRYRIKRGIEQTRRLLKRRGIPVGAAGLTAGLQAQAAEAAAVPPALMTALGKLAIAGRPELVATATAAGGVVGTSKLATIGGAILMWKKISLTIGALALVAGASYYVLQTREEAPVPSTRSPSSVLTGATESPQVEPEDEGVHSTERPEISKEELAAILKKLLDAARGGDSGAVNPSGNARFPPYSSKDVPPDNGAHYFLLAAELFPDVDMNMLYEKWEELRADGFPDDPEFWAILEQFQDAFDAIRTGLEVGNAEMPPWTPGEAVGAPLSKFRYLAKVMSMEALYAAAHGDYEIAFDNYVTVLDFASESSRGGVIISGLLKMSMDRRAAESLREALTWGGAEPGDYRFLIEQMEVLDERTHTIADTWTTEAELVSSWLDKELEAGLDVRGLIEGESSTMAETLTSMSDEQIETLSKDVFDDYPIYVDYLALPYYEARTVDIAALVEEKPLSNVFMPPTALPKIHAQETMARAEVRGTMLSAAIELYRAENDTYPVSLDDLAPNYVSELPEDPFSGESFAYEPTESGYVLYSVGPDMEDDGGTALDDSGAYHERVGDILLHGK